MFLIHTYLKWICVFLLTNAIFFYIHNQRTFKWKNKVTSYFCLPKNSRNSNRGFRNAKVLVNTFQIQIEHVTPSSELQWCRNRVGWRATGPSIFGKSVNPIPTREGRFCPPFATAPPPIKKKFFTFRHPWVIIKLGWMSFKFFPANISICKSM